MNSFNNKIFWTHNRISNWFIIKTNQGAALIDTGAPAVLPKIYFTLKRLQIQPQYILLTHGHADHAGNAKTLAKKFGCQVICHHNELDYLKGMKSRPKRNYQGINPFGRIIQFGDHLFGDPIYEPTIAFNEAAALHDEFEMVLTPGHTKGSAIILHKPTESIFLGDTIHNEKAIFLNPKHGLVLPYPYFCENHQQALASLAVISKLNFKSAFFGHGKPFLDNAKDRLCQFLFDQKILT